MEVPSPRSPFPMVVEVVDRLIRDLDESKSLYHGSQPNRLGIIIVELLVNLKSNRLPEINDSKCVEWDLYYAIHVAPRIGAECSKGCLQQTTRGTL